MNKILHSNLIKYIIKDPKMFIGLILVTSPFFCTIFMMIGIFTPIYLPSLKNFYLTTSAILSIISAIKVFTIYKRDAEAEIIIENYVKELETKRKTSCNNKIKKIVPEIVPKKENIYKLEIEDNKLIISKLDNNNNYDIYTTLDNTEENLEISSNLLELLNSQ